MYLWAASKEEIQAIFFPQTFKDVLLGAEE